MASRQRHELTQVRSQLQSIQMELHKVEVTQSHTAQGTQIYQSELQEKQTIITKLLEQSRVLTASFNSQFQQLKQEYVIK